MSIAPSSGPHWRVGDSLDRVMDAVRGRVASTRYLPDGSFLVNCVNPAHPDRHPSLHISHITTDHGGRVLFRCFTCNDTANQEDWAEWSGLEYDDLFDDRRAGLREARDTTAAGAGRRRPSPAPSLGRLGPLPKPIRKDLERLLGQDTAPTQAPAGPEHTHRWELVETYTYTDPDGRPVHRVDRQRCTEDGCGEKNFPQRYLRKDGRPDRAEDWVAKVDKAGWGSEWAPRLYRLPSVLRAIEDGTPIWVMEGEKDVHSAEGCAVVATTNPGGAENFPAALATVLAGAGQVNVVLDRDKAGWARGVKLAKQVKDAGGPAVQLWLPATETAKSDFTDHLQAGHDLDQLLPVPLAAVTAWQVLTSTVAAAAAIVLTAQQEVEAQLQVAAYDRAQGRIALAADRRRLATRWAQESLRQHARLIEAAGQVRQAVATVPVGDPGRSWAVEAGEAMRTQSRAVTTAVHAACEQAEVFVPPAVDQALEALMAAPATAPSSDTAPDAADLEGTRPELQILQGGGGSGRAPGVVVEHDTYEVVGDEIAQVSWRTRGEASFKVYKRVINAPLRVWAREMAESEEDIVSDTINLDELGDRDGRHKVPRVRSLTQVTHVVLQLPDTDERGPALVRIPFDDWVSGSFLPHLPIAQLDFNGGRTGREKVITAINHISDPQLLTSYRATGWRSRPDGTAMYITASGAIGPQGWEPVATNLTGSMSRFDLPDPSRDPARLRAAWLSATVPMVDDFPDRIGAVLVGQAMRAAVCPNEWVTVLSASPGVGKTGVAALAMHYFGELWDRMKPMSSMSGNGATMNALRILAHQAKDAVVFLDDNAPTTGVEAAWKRLEETIRMIHNQEGRSRSERNGQGTLPELRPRTSALITTELPPRAGTSGERRALIVPMSRRDINIDAIIALDEPQMRHRRALLMSSYLRWLAEDYRGNLLRCAALREEFLTGSRGQLDQRTADRHARQVAELWAGWVLLLEFLTESEAISAQELEQWRERIWAALLVAAEAADDPDLVESTGERARELIRFALTNGLAWVADADTGAAPAGLEKRLGWRLASSTMTLNGVASDWRIDPRAICLGHVQTNPPGEESGPELLCERSGLEAVIKAAAAAMPDTSSLDLGTVLRALEDDGVLKVREERRAHGVIIRKSLDRTIACLRSVSNPDKPLREKRFVLRLAELFGEAGPGGTTPGWPEGADPRPGPSGGATGPDRMPPAPPQPVPAEPAPEPNAPEPPRTESPVDHTNAGSLTLPSRATATGPCAVCRNRCGIELGGIRMHLPCFWATTSSSIEQLRAELAHGGGAAPEATSEEITAEHESAAATASSAPAARQQPTKATQFAAAAAVVDVDAVYLPSGERRELPYPIQHLGDLERLGRELRLGAAPIGTGRTYSQAGTVVPTIAVWAQLGVDLTQLPTLPSRRAAWLAEISQNLPAITDAIEAGWIFGTGRDAPTLKATTKLRRREVDRGSVKILMTAGLPVEWGLSDEVGPERVARRLQLFADTVGMPFSGNPINTGLDLFEAVTPKSTRDLLTPVDWREIPPALNRQLEAHFDWTRTPSSEEASRPVLALFDRGQSYLATWEGLRLGVGAPEHLQGSIAFDAKAAGWWRIALPENTIGGARQQLPYPDLLDPTGRHAGTERWVTTPALAYAVEHLALTPQILEAWVWPPERTKPALTALCKRIRAALAALRAIGDEDAVVATTLVKMTYKQLSGYVISDQAALARSGLSQPYWHHAMIAQARVGILHQILATGEHNLVHGRPNTWPLVVSQTDLVGYAADVADEAPAWPGDPAKLGKGPGQYKLSRWAELGAHAQYLTGRGWSGQDHTGAVGKDAP